MTPFTTERREVGGLIVLDLHGDLDRSGQPVLMDALPDDGTVVLDFEEVGYINSTGIAAVVSFLAGARANGVEVRAFGLTDHYRKIFEITRVADFMDMFDDEHAALAAEGV